MEQIDIELKEGETIDMDKLSKDVQNLKLRLLKALIKPKEDTSEAVWEKETSGVIVGVKPQELGFTVKAYDTDKGKEKREVIIQYKEISYTLTDRGDKNLCKLTGISKRLINELPHDQIIQDINFQMSKIESLGIIIMTDKVISLFNSGKVVYNGYTTLNQLIKEDIKFSWGSAIDSDSIMVQTNQFEDDKFIGGVNCILSSTNNDKNIFAYGILDKTRKIFWRDELFAKETEKMVDKDMVESYVNKMRENVQFMVQLNAQLLSKAEQFKIQNKEHLEGLLVSLPNNKLRKMVLHAYEDRVMDKDLLDKVGISEVSNLRDAFSLLTSVAN